MNKYTLSYWRKKDGIVASLEFDTLTYNRIKNKTYKLLENIITDLAGYTLQKNGKVIEKEVTK